MTTRTMLAGLGGASAGGAPLFIVAAFLGGNLAPNFELASLRGYEATGVLGLLVGVVGGGALGVRLARNRVS